MRNLFTCALRLLASARRASALEPAAALYALAGHYGQVGDVERAAWDSLYGERRASASGLLAFGKLISPERFTEVIGWLASTGSHGLLFSLLGRLGRDADAARSPVVRCHLLREVEPLVTDDIVVEQVVLGRTVLVLYLVALRDAGEQSMTAEERELFSRVVGVDEDVADAVAAFASRIVLEERCGFARRSGEFPPEAWRALLVAGDRVHVSADTDEWGRLAEDGRVFDVERDGHRRLTGRVLVACEGARANVRVRLEECSPAARAGEEVAEARG